jgi:hypothetical protein
LSAPERADGALKSAPYNYSTAWNLLEPSAKRTFVGS